MKTLKEKFEARLRSELRLLEGYIERELRSITRAKGRNRSLDARLLLSHSTCAESAEYLLECLEKGKNVVEEAYRVAYFHLQEKGADVSRPVASLAMNLYSIRHQHLKEQPTPTPGTGDLWQNLIDKEDDGPVRDAMVVRRQIGIDRYGTTLQADNGRDALRDATEEALDLLVYLEQVRVEKGAGRELEQDRVDLLLELIVEVYGTASEVLS